MHFLALSNLYQTGFNGVYTNILTLKPVGLHMYRVKTNLVLSYQPNSMPMPHFSPMYVMYSKPAMNAQGTLIATSQQNIVCTLCALVELANLN